MAVFERTYRRYQGELSSAWGRWLVVPRYAFKEVFNSKLFLAFFVLCFLPPLGFASFVYVIHNSTFLAFFQMLSQGETLKFEPGPNAFHYLLVTQSVFCLLLTLIAAPALIAADLRNNALPLYFARPFSRFEYLAGKASVLVVLLSAVSWIPLLAVFLLQGSMAEGWLAANGWVAGSILVGCGIWIALLCLSGLAVSAALKWKPIASLALFALYFFTWVLGKFLNGLFHGRIERPWGDLVSPLASIWTVWTDLFRLPLDDSLPLWGAWLSLLALAGVCLLLLERTVRAYEEIR